MPPFATYGYKNRRGGFGSKTVLTLKDWCAMQHSCCRLYITTKVWSYARNEFF
jgi:hypothetical protein